MSKLSEKRKAAVESMMKETIYKAAVATLLEHDLDGLTMDRVAEAAEMAKGTLYNYFQDKMRLQLYVFAKVSESFSQEMSTIRQSDLSPPDKLVKIVEQLFYGFEKNRHLLIILAQGRIHNLKEYSRQLAKIQEFANTGIVKYPVEESIELVIQEGIKTNHFQDIDPKLVTDIILGAVTSIIDKQIEDNLSPLVGNDIKQLIRVFMEGLMKSGSSSRQ